MGGLRAGQIVRLANKPSKETGLTPWGKCVCENVVRVVFSPVQRYPTRLFVDMSVRLRHGVASIAMITTLISYDTRVESVTERYSTASDGSLVRHGWTLTLRKLVKTGEYTSKATWWTEVNYYQLRWGRLIASRISMPS